MYAAARCDEAEQAGSPMRRQVGIPAIDKAKPRPPEFRADILADSTVIPALKAVRALLPAHGTQLQP